jgi:hypothetical protein
VKIQKDIVDQNLHTQKAAKNISQHEIIDKKNLNTTQTLLLISRFLLHHYIHITTVLDIKQSIDS